jgi:hypothetical protein
LQGNEQAPKKNLKYLIATPLGSAFLSILIFQKEAQAITIFWFHGLLRFPVNPPYLGGLGKTVEEPVNIILFVIEYSM